MSSDSGIGSVTSATTRASSTGGNGLRAARSEPCGLPTKAPSGVARPRLRLRLRLRPLPLLTLPLERQRISRLFALALSAAG